MKATLVLEHSWIQIGWKGYLVCHEVVKVVQLRAQRMEAAVACWLHGKVLCEIDSIWPVGRCVVPFEPPGKKGRGSVECHGLPVTAKPASSFIRLLRLYEPARHLDGQAAELLAYDVPFLAEFASIPPGVCTTNHAPVRFGRLCFYPGPTVITNWVPSR